MILNGYPIDYYDKYPARLAQVNAEQVRAVMNKYVNPDEMTILSFHNGKVGNVSFR